jgi:hypothetical protein
MKLFIVGTFKVLSLVLAIAGMGLIGKKRINLALVIMSIVAFSISVNL